MSKITYNKSVFDPFEPIFTARLEDIYQRCHVISEAHVPSGMYVNEYDKSPNAEQMRTILNMVQEERPDIATPLSEMVQDGVRLVWIGSQWAIVITSNAISFLGEEDTTKQIQETFMGCLFKAGFDRKSGRPARYYYTTTKGDMKSSSVIVNSNKTFNEGAYPFIEGGAIQKMKDFMESESPIMILLGDPGTGKTTFIRELIHQYTKSTPFIAYDEKTATNEAFLTDFMFSDSEVLVLEDADNLMADRVVDNNKAMSRLLNISSGLINFSKKKIVFTANLRDVSQIDHALIRPGRCFDVINFRPLTAGEASEAFGEGVGAGTVAEISNGAKEYAKKKSFKVGFVK